METYKGYRCKKSFTIEKCDGDGFTTSNEVLAMEVGSTWYLDNESNVFGADVHLESDGDSGFIEISNEDLKEYFEESVKDE